MGPSAAASPPVPIIKPFDSGSFFSFVFPSSFTLRSLSSSSTPSSPRLTKFSFLLFGLTEKKGLNPKGPTLVSFKRTGASVGPGSSGCSPNGNFPSLCYFLLSSSAFTQSVALKSLASVFCFMLQGEDLFPLLLLSFLFSSPYFIHSNSSL